MNKIVEGIKKEPQKAAIVAGVAIATITCTVCTVIMSRKYISHLDQVYAVISEHASEIVIQSSKIAVKS